MKKIILIVLLSAFILSVRSQQTQGIRLRHGERIEAGFGQGNQIITPYIVLPARTIEAYKTNQISSVRIGLNRDASNVTVYVKRRPHDGVVITSQKVGNLTAGWHDIKLAKPVDINGDSLAIGYKASFLEGNEGGAGYSFGNDECANIVFVNSKSTWSSIDGSFCIEAVVTGDALPQNQASLKMFAAPAYIYGERHTFSGVVRNIGGNGFDGLTVDYSVNGGPFVQFAKGGSVGINSNDTLNIDVPVDEADNRIVFRIGRLGNQPDSYAADNSDTLSIQRRNPLYKRRVLMEEGTGDWCKFCVGGIEEVRYLKANYADEFVAVCIHSNDRLEIQDPEHSYEPLLSRMPGFPDCFLNRTYECNPYGTARRFFQQLQERPGTLGLEMSAKFASDSTAILLRARMISETPVTAPDYRISFVLLEDSIPGKQLNGYYGSKGEFFGWEKLPEYVDMNFDDVARGVYNGFNGGLFTNTSMAAGEYRDYDYTLALPAKRIRNKNRLHVVAILLDTDGKVLNCVDAHPAGIVDAIDAASINQSADSGVVLYTISGVRIGTFPSIESANSIVSGGIYIVYQQGKYRKMIFAN